MFQDDIFQVLLSAVSLSERRRLRDVLASRGALRGKKDTVKIQAKATKKSRKHFGLSKVSKYLNVKPKYVLNDVQFFSQYINILCHALAYL